VNTFVAEPISKSYRRSRTWITFFKWPLSNNPTHLPARYTPTHNATLCFLPPDLDQATAESLTPSTREDHKGLGFALAISYQRQHGQIIARHSKLLSILFPPLVSASIRADTLRDRPN